MHLHGAKVLVALAVTLAIPAAARANPDPVYGSLADGCQRNPAGLLSYTSPEWVFVGGKHSGETMRELQGQATLSHTADEDLPESHLSYDMNFDVIPDARYSGLLAGDPKANGGLGNGNYAHDADQGKMHVEWESGAVPTFVWPTEGDRVHMWGQWVWDCGHWGEGIETNFSNPQGSLIGTGDYFLPGQIEGPPPKNLRGEQSELHPMQALAITRRASRRTPAPERETDFYVSNDGTHAYAESVCAKKLSPNLALASYGPDFSACVNTIANNITPLGGRTFEFLAPAPPRPSRRARLTYREEQMVAGHGFLLHLRPSRKGLDVRVTDLRPAADRSPVSFGASFFVGWSKRRAARPTHLRFTLKTLTVVHSLAEPNPNHPTAAGYPDVGVYNLYMDLNGFWNFIGGKGISELNDNSWIPGLGFVHSGQSFTVNRSIDLYVPQRAPVRLEISGRECDLPRIAPCSANAELADANDHPGTAIVSFPSASAALGDRTLASPVPSASDPNYRLTYSIAAVKTGASTIAGAGSSGIDASTVGGNLGGAGTVLSGATTGFPPLCIAGVAPRSRVGVVRVRHGRLEISGRSRETSCTTLPAHGRIRSVWVSIGRSRHARRASGKRSWRISLPTPSRGRHYLWVSARDSAGNVESPVRVPFTVR